MIEFTRFFLSCVVLEAHFWPLGMPWLAWASVFGFYTLSGFLMTRVLRERYGFGLLNLGRFMCNRVLRLWPAYLAVLAVTAAMLLIPGMDQIYGLLHLPRSPFDALANVTVLGLVGTDFRYMTLMTLTVPNSWSLSIEMFCYLLLGAYFAKTPGRLWALGIIGCIALTWSTGTCLARDPPIAEYAPYCFQNRYGVLQAGLIPFAGGGLLQFHIEALRPTLMRWTWPIAAGLTAIALLTWATPALQYTVAPFIGPLAVALLMIHAVRRGAPSRVTDFFGRASYHLFIAQWIIAAMLLRGTPLPRDSAVLALATLAVSLAFSAALVPLEHRIERYRRRVAPAAPVASPKLAAAAAIEA